MKEGLMGKHNRRVCVCVYVRPTITEEFLTDMIDNQLNTEHIRIKR